MDEPLIRITTSASSFILDPSAAIHIRSMAVGRYDVLVGEMVVYTGSRMDCDDVYNEICDAISAVTAMLNKQGDILIDTRKEKE